MSKEYFEVFSVRNFQQEDQQKSHWTRIGTGFVNEDASYNIMLDLMPLPSQETGKVHIHMRSPRPKSENGLEDNKGFSNIKSSYGDEI